MFCLFIFWFNTEREKQKIVYFNIFQKQEFGLIFVKVKDLDNG